MAGKELRPMFWRRRAGAKRLHERPGHSDAVMETLRMGPGLVSKPNSQRAVGQQALKRAVEVVK